MRCQGLYHASGSVAAVVLLFHGGQSVLDDLLKENLDRLPRRATDNPDSLRTSLEFAV